MSINGKQPSDDITGRHVSGHINMPAGGGGAEPPRKKLFGLCGLLVLAGLAVSALGLAGLADLVWRWVA